jgi:hypothetical protein
MFPKTLRRHILLLICIKAAALVLIYYAFVASAAKLEPDGRAVAAHLLNGTGN